MLRHDLFREPAMIVQAISIVLAEYPTLRWSDIACRERDAHRCDLRATICLVLHRLGHRSQEIGEATERHHSNARHMVDRGRALYDSDPIFRARVDRAMQKIVKLKAELYP